MHERNERINQEGAEDNAELVMASKDMVDRVTGWMEDTAEMQTESTLELADANGRNGCRKIMKHLLMQSMH